MPAQDLVKAEIAGVPYLDGAVSGGSGKESIEKEEGKRLASEMRKQNNESPSPHIRTQEALEDVGVVGLKLQHGLEVGGVAPILHLPNKAISLGEKRKKKEKKQQKARAGSRYCLNRETQIKERKAADLAVGGNQEGTICGHRNRPNWHTFLGDELMSAGIGSQVPNLDASILISRKKLTLSRKTKRKGSKLEEKKKRRGMPGWDAKPRR